MLTSLSVNTWTCLCFPTTLTSCLLNLLCRECILSAIEDDALTPLFKRLICALWCNTHVHCVTDY